MSAAAFAASQCVTAIVIASCTVKARADDKMPVVATFSVIADMVQQIAEDRVDLITIVGADGDSELYRPTLADQSPIAGAKIVFVNGI